MKRVLWIAAAGLSLLIVTMWALDLDPAPWLSVARSAIRFLGVML